MTFFGQFFDHGLDLVTKGGNGTVFIPLQPDDPLYVPGSTTNFMVLTRATLGAERPAGQHVDALRRPEPDLHLASLAPGVPARVRVRCDATGKCQSPPASLLERRRRRRHGDLGGREGAGPRRARHRLTTPDVVNVPLLATDPYGNFIPRRQRLPAGRDRRTVRADVADFEGKPSRAGQIASTAVTTGHAFLDDIAHNAAPGIDSDLAGWTVNDR